MKKVRPLKIDSRVDEKEKKTIEAKAKKWARGNLSEWIREASLNYEPKGDSNGK